MQKVTIFTDGSSRGNPGPGGWAAVIIFEENNNGSNVKEIGGSDKKTTNNRMELKASIEALKHVETLKLKPNSSQLIIYTDSAYLVNGITKWVYSWEKRNWITINKEPVLNKDLWEDLLGLVKNKKIDWKTVEGHVGVKGNERADVIATAYADGETIELYNGTLSGYHVKDVLNISLNKDLKNAKGEAKKKSGGKAYSYVSLLDGKVQTHKTWAECEARVKGKKARFRKVLSADEEKALITEWGKK